MLKKVKTAKTAKLDHALHIADVCKKLHGKKCPNALNGLLVALGAIPVRPQLAHFLATPAKSATNIF